MLFFRLSMWRVCGIEYAELETTFLRLRLPLVWPTKRLFVLRIELYHAVSSVVRAKTFGLCHAFGL